MTELNMTYCRLHPDAFFQLTPELQEHYICELCGPMKEYVFTFNRDGQIDIIREYASLVLERIDAALIIFKWKTAGRLMEFFGISYTGHGVVNLQECISHIHFKAFIKVFPFGCFDLNRKPTLRLYNYAQEWVYGRPVDHIVLLSFMPDYIDDALFEKIMNAMHITEYFTDDVANILSLIVRATSVYPQLHGRRNLILKELGQKRLMDSNTMYDLYRFAFLMPNLTGLTVGGNEKLRFDRPWGFVIPNPIWNRQSHALLTSEQFNCEALVILQMQKFRFCQFPLHRDLLNLVLTKLFEGHLEDLEKRICYRNELYYTLTNGSDDDRLRFGLKQEIIIANWVEDDQNNNFDRLLDAVHSSMGIQIAYWEHRTKYYAALIRQAIYQKATIGSSLCELTRSYDIGNVIMKYCKEHGIDLYNVIMEKLIFIFEGKEVVGHKFKLRDVN